LDFVIDLSLEISHLSFCMPEVIPAIIAKDFEDLKNKLKLVEPYVQTVQLDIMDGVFVPNKTWPFANAQGEPSVGELSNLETNLFLEVHLMVQKLEEFLGQWLVSKVGRLIVHWEAVGAPNVIASPALAGRSNPTDSGDRTGLLRRYASRNDIQVYNFIEESHRNSKEFSIALNLETPISVLDNFVSEIDSVLLMSVEPGLAGQEFQEGVIPKIIALRQKYPSVKIGVDGGVNLQNAKRLKDAGADFLAVGSAIFGSDDIGREIKDLKDAVS